MMCSVVPCCKGLLHVVQRCYTWNRVVEFCAAVFYVVLFLHVMQCCYMLPRIITCCAVLLDATKSYYILSSVVACYLVLLYAVHCF